MKLFQKLINDRENDNVLVVHCISEKLFYILIGLKLFGLDQTSETFLNHTILKGTIIFSSLILKY